MYLGALCLIRIIRVESVADWIFVRSGVEMEVLALGSPFELPPYQLRTLAIDYLGVKIVGPRLEPLFLIRVHLEASLTLILKPFINGLRLLAPDVVQLLVERRHELRDGHVLQVPGLSEALEQLQNFSVGVLLALSVLLVALHDALFVKFVERSIRILKQLLACKLLLS